MKRTFICSINPTNNLGPRGSAADVGEFREAESFNDVVEVGRRCNREASEENSASVEENRFQPWFMSHDRLFKSGKMYCSGTSGG
ncbi:hypothetical protein HanXRQr2_Chr09g0416151 [Helianthus annuus]|uniref:Uncharacterized protein n=1 Tax=Helianthus annuus TaxID=4232 RepID=A0A9K3IBA4_HELAN|nr:hypothetical protein HanXRQr2_Chr09g0416151 [Helianthus annuus]KAJ0537041.1 hypothetical protein HanIR_Chr09g0448381 [Helianthus annuus]KAJ0895603.1 hypothetical protein HanPSC8_Chr09g0402441 [Helianthus annuus]